MADKGKERLLFHQLIKILQDNYEDQMADAMGTFLFLFYSEGSFLNVYLFPHYSANFVMA